MNQSESETTLARYCEGVRGGTAGIAGDRLAAAIGSRMSAVTIYRRHNKPALGPLGDCLDDLDPALPLNE